jgi:hypothetical protein
MFNSFRNPYITRPDSYNDEFSAGFHAGYDVGYHDGFNTCRYNYSLNYKDNRRNTRRGTCLYGGQTYSQDAKIYVGPDKKTCQKCDNGDWVDC